MQSLQSVAKTEFEAITDISYPLSAIVFAIWSIAAVISIPISPWFELAELLLTNVFLSQRIFAVFKSTNFTSASTVVWLFKMA